MNMKEMEAALLALQNQVAAATDLVRARDDAFDALRASVSRIEGGLDGVRREMEAVRLRNHDISNALATLHGKVEVHDNDVARQYEHNEANAAVLTSMGVETGALNVRTGEALAQLEQLGSLVEDLRMKVEGRNRSAPVKRNMTDEDALRVLKGDLTSIGHKEAAERVGLTYAQVYSCRLGFTFKHVIRDLEKDGWRSPWAKG
jgi:Mg-chelatase subunit ChlI